MVPFGGWDMPVEYSGLISEHMAVRKAAGLFDVSHMGEFEVEGPGALALPAARHLATTWRSSSDGQAQYSALPTAERRARRRRDRSTAARADRYLMVVNAGNIEKDFDVAAGAGARRTATLDEPQRRVRAARAAGPARAGDPAGAHRRSTSRRVKYYHFAEGAVAGVAGHGLAHRLHGRGRVRDLRGARARGRAALARAARGGRATRACVPAGPGRARHAAPRGADVPLRERHGRDHHAGRGGPGLDRLPGRGQGRLPGPRGAGGAEEGAARRASSWASR